MAEEARVPKNFNSRLGGQKIVGISQGQNNIRNKVNPETVLIQLQRLQWSLHTKAPGDRET